MEYPVKWCSSANSESKPSGSARSPSATCSASTEASVRPSFVSMFSEMPTFMVTSRESRSAYDTERTIRHPAALSHGWEFFPAADVLPTWTGCVGLVIALRWRAQRRETALPPRSPNAVCSRPASSAQAGEALPALDSRGTRVHTTVGRAFSFWGDEIMGLLDDLLGSALGGGVGQQGTERSSQGSAAAGSGGPNIMTALLPVVLSMLASRGGGSMSGGGGLGNILGQVLGGGTPTGTGGGLGGLLEQMQRAGFGDHAQSWVGTGQNMSIPPDAIGQIFGQGGLDDIARHANLTRQQTSEGLSQLLPELVDRVTPGGQDPGFDQLIRSVDDLRQRMGA